MTVNLRNMNLYTNIIYPFLAKGDAEKVHELTLLALESAEKIPLSTTALHTIRGRVPTNPVPLFGLTFPNQLGMAAGFDKDVRVVAGLAALGFGHIEVGTLTPCPQVGNPKPRIFRLATDGAIINRMGFPNGGVDAALPRLRKLAQKERDWILGVSLGKQKETPLADASADYVTVMRKVYAYSDYLAVNVSSPNTPGLRELQGRAYLDQLLSTLMEEGEHLATQYNLKPKPLLLKIAPDMDEASLGEILAAAKDAGIAGMIATNTTIGRNDLTHANKSEAGGMSGKPLRQRSTEVVRFIAQNSDLPVIGVGGIDSAESAREKLDAGASLVQLYSGLVYQGPRLAGKILRGLSN